MNCTLEEFINLTEPHQLINSCPPSSSEERHKWESMLLYSIKNKLKEDVILIDYGSGEPGTLKANLKKRYKRSRCYSLDIEREGLEKDEFDKDCYIGNINFLEKIINKVDCIVAGSVLTHLSWEQIVLLLDKLSPLFSQGGEFGFSFFNGKNYNLYSKIDKDLHGKTLPGFYHVVELPIEFLENYCQEKRLKLDLLDYSFDLDHHIVYDGKTFARQSFCNIKK